MDCELLATAKITAVSLLLLTALWRICGSFLHRLFTRKLTVLYDLPEIGKARPDNKRIKGTAVICGGSIAGLFTARICADHFEDVLIIEPEAWLETKEGRTAVYDEKGAYIESRREHKRTRVEQYLRLHLCVYFVTAPAELVREKKWILSAFLPVIIMALKHLAADFEENMRRSDGRIQDAQYNILAYGRYTMRLPTDGKPPQSLYASREAFERVLRGSIMKSSSRIRWMVGTVTGVETSPRDASRLSGVNVRTPSGTKGFIDAAFIADCSGPAQAGLKWLKRVYTELEKDASLAATLEHVSNALPFDKLTLNYSIAMRARKYRFYVPTEARARLPIPGGYENAGWIFATLPKPGELRSFIVDRIEGHRIELALSARGELDFPPHFADIKPFMRAVSATNPVPEWVFEMMDILLEYKDQVEDLGSEKSPSCYLTRYERAPYLPSNFAAIGDATMRVNPQYESARVHESMHWRSRPRRRTSLSERAQRYRGPFGFRACVREAAHREDYQRLDRDEANRLPMGVDDARAGREAQRRAFRRGAWPDYAAALAHGRPGQLRALPRAFLPRAAHGPPAPRVRREGPLLLGAAEIRAGLVSSFAASICAFSTQTCITTVSSIYSGAIYISTNIAYAERSTYTCILTYIQEIKATAEEEKIQKARD